jgi:hypothetical protein
MRYTEKPQRASIAAAATGDGGGDDDDGDNAGQEEYEACK